MRLLMHLSLRSLWLLYVRTVAPLLIAALLSGCWDRTEINDLAIITAAGIDRDDDGKIKLSVQVFVPTPASSEQGASSSGRSSKTVVRYAKGFDMADATARLQETLSRKIFWGQADVFIFGKSLAKHSIKEPMDFLTRHPHPRERANLFVSSGEAEEVIRWNTPIERNSAESLRELSVLQTGLNTSILQVIEELSEEAHTAVIPIIRILHKEGTSVPFIGGTVAFKDLRQAATLNSTETRGLLWLRDEIKTATITAPAYTGGDYASANIISSKSKLIPSIKGDKWSMLIVVEATSNLNENASDLDITKEENIKKLEHIFEGVIQSRIDNMVKKAQKSGVDYIGFAEQFHRHYPKHWHAAKKNWDTLFPKVEVRYKIRLTIARNGLTGKNTALQGSVRSKS
ncbi:Ger(x)C family spore germination protein [Paenibacillus xylaniclasticus]|uniref:Ger(x)C family spore germination protein n=1 Tax=Paenibacillus xylaniclasticus TaxID=588083 RepID=UPI000FD6C433|nr:MULTISPECIES: Ger(x)C family spore germination protein [Paenibacillus]GFN32706.1 germination protein [Paenibacillus curdlanolyticus]